MTTVASQITSLAVVYSIDYLWFTYDLRPQTPQGESVTEHAKPEALLLIILSFVCKSDIKEVHGD